MLSNSSNSLKENEKSNTNSDRKKVKWLIDKKVLSDAINNKILFSNERVRIPPISYFSKIGLTSKVFEILKQDAKLVNVRTSNLKTPLMFACQYGNFNCARILLLAKAQINLQDEFGLSALMYAVGCNHYEITKLLIKNKADPFLTNFYGENAMKIANNKNNKKIISLLKKYIETIEINIKSSK